MSKLTKDEVISTLQSALEQKHNKPVSIEQKGGWYKIDGGKSMRFSELEAMLEELGNKEVKAVETPKAASKASIKAVPAKQRSGHQGMMPKEFWRQKLSKHNAQLPRGF